VQVARLACSPRDAFFARHTLVPLSEAAGRVSADIITIYPPGIPILVPGEEVSQTAVEYLQFLGRRGARIDGVLDPALPSNGAPGPAVPEPQVRVLAA
jgi:arginine/lysine/ornithine decarboxylase